MPDISAVRIARYTRQSQDRSQEGLGTERQRADCQRVEDLRWPGAIVEEFEDNDVSATKHKPRPKFTEMMKRVDEGEFDIVLSRHMDRLLRKLSEFVEVRDRCKASKTHIITAADGVDTSTPAGEMVAGILAVVAEGEMGRKSERQLSSVTQAVQQGRWLGGWRPFGYEADGVTIRPEEAEILRQGYIDILAGESLAGVARNWNSKCTTPRGRQWTRQVVKEVLGNPRYAGIRRHRPHSERSNRDPRIGIVGKAEWPAIVDEPMWSAAVRALYDPARQRVAGGKALLSGVAVCGSAVGDGICGEFVGRGQIVGGMPTYRCRTNVHSARKAEPVDKYVTELALKRLTEPDAALLWQVERPDASALMGEANDLREELAAIDQDRAEGRLDRMRWRTMNDRVQRRLDAIEAEIARAGETSPLAIVAAADVRAAWEELSINRRRAIIAALMTPVLIPPGQGVRQFRPETVNPGWKKEAEPTTVVFLPRA